jgi:hypothetical protein
MKRIAIICGILVLLAGCPKKEEKDRKDKAETSGERTPKLTRSGQVDDTSADGWWCNTHGIPEDECSMCSAKVEKACRAKGDWCDKHERAKSQCFKCNPALKEEFAKRYRSRYGKEPPEPTE